MAKDDREGHLIKPTRSAMMRAVHSPCLEKRLAENDG